MAEINDGGPAFPFINDGSHLPGMSLRDYFAAQALAGWMADPNASASTAEVMATQCYAIADGMLAARTAP